MKKKFRLLLVAIIVAIIATIVVKNNAKADNVMPTELTVGSTIIVKYDVGYYNVEYSWRQDNAQCEQVNANGQPRSSSDAFDGYVYMKYTFNNPGNATLYLDEWIHTDGQLREMSFTPINIRITEEGTRRDVGLVATDNKTETASYTIKHSGNDISNILMKKEIQL